MANSSRFDTLSRVSTPPNSYRIRSKTHGESYSSEDPVMCVDTYRDVCLSSVLRTTPESRYDTPAILSPPVSTPARPDGCNLSRFNGTLPWCILDLGGDLLTSLSRIERGQVRLPSHRYIFPSLTCPGLYLYLEHVFSSGCLPQ